MAYTPSSIHDFSLKLVDGSTLFLNTFKGNPVVIVNAATLADDTSINFTQLNQLQEFFGHTLHIVAVLCDQFGNANKNRDDEALKMLSTIRPGAGYAPKFSVAAQVEVNGKSANPLFKYLLSQLPLPSDDKVSLTASPMDISWEPVTRSDISNNFAKFLIGRDGVPIKRYSPAILPLKLEADIRDV